MPSSYVIRSCIWENKERCGSGDREVLNITSAPETYLTEYRHKHFNQWFNKPLRDVLMVVAFLILPLSISVGICDSLWVPIVIPSRAFLGTENDIKKLLEWLASMHNVRHIWQPWFWEGTNIWYVSKFAGLDSLVRFMALFPCVCLMAAFDAYTADLLVDLLPPQLPNAYLLAKIHEIGSYKAALTILGSMLVGCCVWVAGMQLASYVLLNIFDPEDETTLELLHRSAQFKAATKRLEDWLEGVFVVFILATMVSIFRYYLASAAWNVSYPTLGDYNTVAGWLPLPLLLDFQVILLNGVLATVVIGLAHRQYKIVQWHCESLNELSNNRPRSEPSNNTKLKYMVRVEEDNATLWITLNTHCICCSAWGEKITWKWMLEFHLMNSVPCLVFHAMQGMVYSFRREFHDAQEEFPTWQTLANSVLRLLFRAMQGMLYSLRRMYHGAQEEFYDSQEDFDDIP